MKRLPLIAIVILAIAAAFYGGYSYSQQKTADATEKVGKYNQVVNTSQQRQPITCNTYNYDMLNSSTTRCW